MTDRETPPDAQADKRCFAPAVARNREPILEILSEVLPLSGLILEIASGTGEHAAYFAPRLAPRIWQPSDPDPELRQSIAAHAAEAGCTNLRPPLDLDASASIWPLKSAQAVVCINMIHIAPWTAAEGLIVGAASILAAGGGGPLFLYGPFKRGGQHTAPSNAAFDSSLRTQDRTWGVRDLEDVEALAEKAGFGPARIFEMPANNLSLVFSWN